MTDCYFETPAAGIMKRAANIRLLGLDVDGVLTDGSVYIGERGEALKAFHIHDGKGIRMLLDAGCEVALLTARSSPAVDRRAEELGIRHVHQGQKDKWKTLAGLMAELGLAAERVAYVGDDLVDMGILTRVGLAVAVGDAHPAVAAAAHWQTRRRGGTGAVREVCEMILEAQGRLKSIIESHANG